MSNIIRQDRYRHLRRRRRRRRRRRHPSSNSFQIATFQLNLRTPRLSLSSSSRCPAVAATKIDITLLRSRIWFNWTRLLFGIKSICFREILDFLARLIYNFSGVWMPCLRTVLHHLTPGANVISKCFLLARSLQGVFLLPLIPWIEQGGSSLVLVTLLYDLCDGLT